jgi:hypothetical protein
MAVDKAGRVHLVATARLLHPEQQMVEEMPHGWRNQQLCRTLPLASINRPSVMAFTRACPHYLGLCSEAPREGLPGRVAAPLWRDVVNNVRGRAGPVPGRLSRNRSGHGRVRNGYLPALMVSDWVLLVV